MNTTLLSIITLSISVITLSVAVYSWLQVLKLKKLRHLLLKNNPPLTLEETLNKIYTHITVLERNQLSTQSQLDVTQRILQGAIQKVGIVKFNSLSNDGGNFSFSVCLLNHLNTGIILSSLYGREHNRVYIKAIQNGQSEVPLTQEEKAALSKVLPKDQLAPIPESE